MTSKTFVTFKHLVAGSTYITQKGKTCQFAGKKGALGYYSTSDEQEIKELMELANAPNVQVEKQVDSAVPVPVEQDVMIKRQDPSIAKAADEAAAPALLEATPEVASARDKLASVIASAGKK